MLKDTEERSLAFSELAQTQMPPYRNLSKNWYGSLTEPESLIADCPNAKFHILAFPFRTLTPFSWAFEIAPHSLQQFESTLLRQIFDKQQFKMSNSELAASYAALILADDGLDITVRLLRKLFDKKLIITGRQDQHPHQGCWCR